MTQNSDDKWSYGEAKKQIWRMFSEIPAHIDYNDSRHRQARNKLSNMGASAWASPVHIEAAYWWRSLIPPRPGARIDD